VKAGGGDFTGQADFTVNSLGLILRHSFEEWKLNKKRD
jgi:hypothetical protein